MANICNYLMKVVGDAESREKWYQLMTDDSLDNHFCRIFDCDLVDEDEDYTLFSGNCAWSIEVCCRGGYSDDRDLLAHNSAELNVDVEVFSEEPDMGFQEHYIYEHGECTLDDDENVEIVDLDDDDAPPTEELLAEGYEYDGTGDKMKRGGIEHWGEFRI